MGAAVVTGKAVKSLGETMTAAFAVEVLTAPVAAAASDKAAVFGIELGIELETELEKEAAELGTAAEAAAAAAAAAMTHANAERQKGPKTGYPRC